MKTPRTLVSQPAPLSAHALDALRDVAYSPVPTQAINPGVVSRLLRDALIELVDLPSPYKTHNGKRIAFAKITDKGRKTALPAQCARQQDSQHF